MDKWKAFTGGAGAVLVPAFEFFYGPGDIVLLTMLALLFFIVLDWMSGVSAAKKDASYASRYGIDGVIRTFFMLLLPAGGHLLDKIFGLPGFVFGTLAFGTLYHVIQSMTANTIRAGWSDWVPLPVLNLLIKWVKSELDQKIQRAESRKVVKEVPRNETGMD
ncbi:holin [Paenibacillus campinasensis]|uniref:Holin n=1 Tax=Paenibacillus campinasensis TaxID=66347 RepID=A0ABW9T8L9_9BACL|nr:phage holin family protein [Paenibacillus campinasensis]MUG68629.1 holin [Paenibacillus campinasensis]